MMNDRGSPKRLGLNRIERMLEEIEAAVVPSEARVWVILNDTDDEAQVKEKKAKALAEHLARRPEDVGCPVRWLIHEIVHRRASAAELSEEAAATQDEISKGEISYQPVRGNGSAS